MSVIAEMSQSFVSTIKQHVLLTGGLAVCASVMLLAAAQDDRQHELDLQIRAETSDLGLDGGSPDGRFMRAVTTADAQPFAGSADNGVGSRGRRDLVHARLSYPADGEASETVWTSSRTRR